jgi:2-dehydro-3-deoxyphosphooctonate aldolase (KDO 8-P synthase)
MTSPRTIPFGGWEIGAGNPLSLIAGPCVIESEDHCLKLATRLKAISSSVGVPLIFKASYDKANRTSLRSYRGPGLEEGLEILVRVRDEMGLPVLSDVHEVSQVAAASEVLDVLQIPAFLCRQTDLIVAAADTGKAVNIKKGQFLAPWDIGPVLEKAESTGNSSLMVTERGVGFGYNNLVVDFKGLASMRRLGIPIVFDATHSVQLPGGAGGSSSGQRELIFDLARAAVAVGVDALFLEVHDDPDSALSDGPNALQIDLLEGILILLKKIDLLVKRRGNTTE